MINPGPSEKYTKSFYAQLMNEEVKHVVWGKDQRFNLDKILNSQSVQNYFLDEIMRIADLRHARVLDFGCGVGGFSVKMSPWVQSVVAADIVPELLLSCQNYVTENEINNVETRLIVDGKIQADDNEFDAVVMVDVLHHIENIWNALVEVKRVVKPGGRWFVFEPNVYNPLLAFLCLLDKNEWGALKLGTKQRYLKLLEDFIDIDHIYYNGLLIGPDNNFFLKLASFVSHKDMNPVIQALSPKIYISGIQK